MNSEEFFSKLKSLIPDNGQEDYERNFVIMGGKDAIFDIYKILGMGCEQEGIQAAYTKSRVFISGLGYFDIIIDNAKADTEVSEGSTIIGNL